MRVSYQKRERSGAMGRGKSKQASLAGTSPYPLLSKTAVAVGKYCLVPGSFWVGCPQADKKKLYKCITTQFDPIHTQRRWLE